MVNRPRPSAGHSPPWTAEVKSKWHLYNASALMTCPGTRGITEALQISKKVKLINLFLCTNVQIHNNQDKKRQGIFPLNIKIF
jgi:hypothetical protein